MTLLALITAGFLVALTIPIFLRNSREDRGRLAGMLGGAYLSAISMAGILYLSYVAIFHGATSIGRRAVSTSLEFAEQPLMATIVLLITIAGLGCFAALGWVVFRQSRGATHAP